ncbi:unnamed protein product [Bursaphelenchus okinawaensis]|uniref:MFS domain-containing protein n=1 Tax=Bursaphelenchus okinawaensis TaxID=465554 RepID=A0A811LDA8_9BILA|nr:unnamed protein product [Bursaphelenchus okinawaensis]CAG9120417.1 unnamed protein product [Bursaphelenchus okinawaensis]
MLPYMASYMKKYADSSVTLEKLIWIPTFQGCFPFAMVIGGYLSSRLGPRLAAGLGCAMMSGGVFLSYFTIKHSFLSFLFTYGFMFGLGQGIAYVIAVSCVINWAPHMVGLGSGIVAAGFGISSSIFAPIQTRMINPDNLAASKEGYFNETALLERVPDTFLSLSIVYGLMQLIGLIVVCDPPQDFVRKHLDHSALIDMAWLSKKRSQYMGQNKVSFNRYGYVKLPVKRDSVEFDSPTRKRPDQDVEIQDSDSDDDLNIKPESQSMTPEEMLKSSTFHWLFVALFCCSFYGNFFYNLYKTFGETFIEDDFFFATAFSIGSAANALARIGWGLLTDKTSFQVSLSSATFIATILLLTMPITAHFGKFAYLLWLTGMFVCLAATHALFITAAVRCFGTKYKTINYGFLIFSTTCSGITLAIGCQYLLGAIGYTWAFIFAAAFPFIAFIITTAIRVTPQGHLIV